MIALTFKFGDLSEKGVLNIEPSHSDHIPAEEANHSPRPVGDVELGAVVDVCAALGVIEQAVEVAGSRQSALLRGHPQVGRAGVEHHAERLAGRPDRDVAELGSSVPVVLRVEVVVDLDFGVGVHAARVPAWEDQA